ncbi:MAG: GIY-YIG nuclease family protein [Patescibacteria group bacterium]
MQSYYVYIMASQKNGTLYVGVPNDLRRRVDEHKVGAVPGFTRQYHVHTLVYYEEFSDIYAAITREKQMKRWKRAWKLRLIEEVNPGWKDLSDDF